MIKIQFALRRLPELSLEEFQSYWHDTHADVVRLHASALKIRRYVQSHARPGDLSDLLRVGRGSPEGFDGLAEIWWESIEEMRSAAGSPQGRIAGAALLEDEKRFIDLPRSPIWLSEERSII